MILVSTKTRFTAESSLFLGDHCLWLSWVTLSQKRINPHNELYKHLFNIYLNYNPKLATNEINVPTV